MITIYAHELHKAVQECCTIIPRSPSLPILANVRLTATGSTMTIQSTDLERGIERKIDIATGDSSAIDITLPAITLRDILYLYDKSQLSLSLDDSTQTVLFTEIVPPDSRTRSNFRIKGIAATEFPPLPAEIEIGSVFSQYTVQTPLKKKITAVSKQTRKRDSAYIHVAERSTLYVFHDRGISQFQFPYFSSDDTDSPDQPDQWLIVDDIKTLIRYLKPKNGTIVRLSYRDDNLIVSNDDQNITIPIRYAETGLTVESFATGRVPAILNSVLSGKKQIDLSSHIAWSEKYPYPEKMIGADEIKALKKLNIQDNTRAGFYRAGNNSTAIPAIGFHIDRDLTFYVCLNRPDLIIPPRIPHSSKYDEFTEQFMSGAAIVTGKNEFRIGSYGIDSGVLYRTIDGQKCYIAKTSDSQNRIIRAIIDRLFKSIRTERDQRYANLMSMQRTYYHDRYIAALKNGIRQLEPVAAQFDTDDRNVDPAMFLHDTSHDHEDLNNYREFAKLLNDTLSVDPLNSTEYLLGYLYGDDVCLVSDLSNNRKMFQAGKTARKIQDVLPGYNYKYDDYHPGDLSATMKQALIRMFTAPHNSYRHVYKRTRDALVKRGFVAPRSYRLTETGMNRAAHYIAHKYPRPAAVTAPAIYGPALKLDSPVCDPDPDPDPEKQNNRRITIQQSGTTITITGDTYMIRNVIKNATRRAGGRYQWHSDTKAWIITGLETIPAEIADLA